MYFIEEIDKPCNCFRKKYPQITVKDNKILINGIYDEMDEKRSIKLANKIDKILKKTKSNKIVLSKRIQKNATLKNMLYSSSYNIVDGKWLFEGLSFWVIEYIVKKKKIKMEECHLSVLVNELTDYTLQNIKKLAQNFKLINIVTNHIEKFKKIEQKIQEESGLLITITNNKKKSLLKSQIILNIDFPTELLNKYNINNEAIIVDIKGNTKINKKRFNGIIVKDYEINIESSIIDNSVGTSQIKYYKNQIYEAEFYKNISFLEFTKKVKKDKCIIIKLFGKNSEF